MEVPIRLQGTGYRKNRKNRYQVSGNSKQLTGKAGSRDQGSGRTGNRKNRLRGTANS
jgi:hypothetical protein